MKMDSRTDASVSQRNENRDIELQSRPSRGEVPEVLGIERAYSSDVPLHVGSSE